MSKPPNTTTYDSRARLPLFLFLLGTLAFSLSSLPGHQNTEPVYSVTSLSSEFASTCANMSTRIDAGAEDGTCEFTPIPTRGVMAKVEGRVEVKRVPKRDSTEIDKMSSGLCEYTVHAQCKGDECPEGVGSLLTAPVTQGDCKSINTKVWTEFKSLAEFMAAKIKQTKVLADKEKENRRAMDRCETNEDGKKIKDQIACRIGRSDNMNEEDAAEYFEDEILSDVKKLVGSRNLRDQKRGQRLLRQLREANNGDELVKGVLIELSTVNEAQLRLLTMAPNDVRRTALTQTMRTAAWRAENYFPDQSSASTIGPWQRNPLNDFTNSTPDGLQGFRAQMDQAYADVLARHKTMLENPALRVGPQVNTDPRDLRAPVTFSSPTQPWPGVPQQAGASSKTPIPKAGTSVR